MIHVGIDDTDTLADPGTNQLARHIVRELAGRFHGRMIIRHQLLEDPRVPCTRKNGCASLLFESKSSQLGDRGQPSGGTEDGVIVALAAVGLLATKNDGRVVHFGSRGEDWYDVSGCLTVDEILARGVAEIRAVDGGEPVTAGTIDVGKRLRPNFRAGRVVLFVQRRGDAAWEAARLT
jgi:hypothetical protein